MLILSRKKDERIVINDNIKIQVVDVKTDAVKIGIEAPDHIKIYREEVWISIHAENKQAANTDSKDVPESLSHVSEELKTKLKSKQSIRQPVPDETNETMSKEIQGTVSADPKENN